jgi:ABC-type bacteriocin/lantibiotic exporter with double-glycine peptidase domain
METQMQTDSNTLNQELDVSDPLLSDIVVTSRNDHDWFIIVEDKRREQKVYLMDSFLEQIKEELITGILSAENTMERHVKEEDGTWKTEKLPLSDFIDDFRELRMLYKPVRLHAITGLIWGLLGGIALKIIDTAILFGAADPLLAFLFLGAIALIFIPRIGFFGMIIAIIAISWISPVNIYLAAISAALTGAILGCLPGMFIGGVVGLIREVNIPKAHEAGTESLAILKFVLLPLVGGVGLIYTYIFYFNPWLMNQMQ